MKNNQNVIIAIGLSLLVVIGWQYFVIGPKMQAERNRQAAEQTQTTTPAPAAGSTAEAPAVGGAAPPAGTAAPPTAPAPAAAPVTREAAIAATPRVAIETPALKGSINLVGGRIDDLRLADYRETVDPTSPLVELFAPAGTEHPYYAEFGWVAEPGGPVVPTADTQWSASEGPLAPGHDVTLTWNNGAGLTFKRIYSVDDHYMFTLRQSVENASGAAVALHPYGLVNRGNIPKTHSYYILHEGLIGYLGSDGLQEIKYNKLTPEEPSITPAKTNAGWLGITDKYWAAAMIPSSGEAFQPRFLMNPSGAAPSYQASFLGDAVSVPAGGTVDNDTRLFAGAKETKLIDGYRDSLNIPHFDLMIDWGWFFFITKPMFQLIDWLYHILGNFGLAILAVTVLVKAVFFPLANRSYASMSKMKMLQPKMKEMQERFKDDRMGLQQAMMKLYKDEKVNPVAGCWPMVIQIPVFFSLYKVLFITIEMRHAPFFGWIRDLSAPDPTTVFNLFGLIPWVPPPSLHFGVWPLIMGVTMFVQMRMNPTPPDKTQAMIFNWMPLIFTFMLASFPAGLVIYWAWNNTLSVIQQGLIMKRHGVPIELFGNLKSLVSRSKPKDSPAK
jgi:YidC/Oxa1 family membrane protein insertase